jgi:hypothetical protein
MLGARAVANNDQRPWKWEVDGHGRCDGDQNLGFKVVLLLVFVSGAL